MKLFSKSIASNQNAFSLKSGIASDMTAQLPVNGVRVFITDGQSQVRGGAANANARPSELGVQSNVKMYVRATTEFQDLNIGVNDEGRFSYQHGMLLGLAQMFNQFFPNEILYVIQNGVGGTGIESWIPGGSNFDNSIIDTTTGINILINEGKIPVAHKIFWQGENDNGLPDKFAFLGFRWDVYKSTWRTYFPNIPLIIGELVDTKPTHLVANNLYRDKDAADPLVKAALIGYRYHNGDQLHFGYAAQKTIAEIALRFMSETPGAQINSIINLVQPIANTMRGTLLSVAEVTGTFTFNLDITDVDDLTINANLFYRIYTILNDDELTIYHTTETSIADADVTVISNAVTIINIPLVSLQVYRFAVSSVDENGIEEFFNWPRDITAT